MIWDDFWFDLAKCLKRRLRGDSADHVRWGIAFCLSSSAWNLAHAEISDLFLPIQYAGCCEWILLFHIYWQLIFHTISIHTARLSQWQMFVIESSRWIRNVLIVNLSIAIRMRALAGALQGFGVRRKVDCCWCLRRLYFGGIAIVWLWSFIFSLL